MARLVPLHKAAKELGLGQHYLRRALFNGVIPKDAVVLVGPRKFLIDLGQADRIIRAIAEWSWKDAGDQGDAWLKRQIERAGGQL